MIKITSIQKNSLVCKYTTIHEYIPIRYLGKKYTLEKRKSQECLARLVVRSLQLLCQKRVKSRSSWSESDMEKFRLAVTFVLYHTRYLIGSRQVLDRYSIGTRWVLDRYLPTFFKSDSTSGRAEWQQQPSQCSINQATLQMAAAANSSNLETLFLWTFPALAAAESSWVQPAVIAYHYIHQRPTSIPIRHGRFQ